MNTLESLAQVARSLSQTVSTEFARLDLSALNFKTAPDSWSILEHLNRLHFCNIGYLQPRLYLLFELFPYKFAFLRRFYFS